MAKKRRVLREAVRPARLEAARRNSMILGGFSPLGRRESQSCLLQGQHNRAPAQMRVLRRADIGFLAERGRRPPTSGGRIEAAAGASSGTTGSSHTSRRQSVRALRRTAPNRRVSAGFSRCVKAVCPVSDPRSRPLPAHRATSPCTRDSREPDDECRRTRDAGGAVARIVRRTQ